MNQAQCQMQTKGEARPTFCRQIAEASMDVFMESKGPGLPNCFAARHTQLFRKKCDQERGN